MAKKVISWTKPAGKEGLIGIKKVDDSVFKYGVHIPLSFREEFKKANQMKDVEEGKAEKIKLIFDDKFFDAELRSIRMSSTDGIALQIRYDSKSELKDFLKKTFHTSYEYITIEKERRKEKTIKIPEHLGEYMEFYQTDEPFKYRIVVRKKEEDLLPYPFREVFEVQEQVEKARQWIKNILSVLGINNNNNPLFSINYRKDQNGIFVNYGSWRIFGVWRKKSRGLSIDLAISKKVSFIEVKEYGGSFTMQEGEEQIDLNRYAWEDVMEHEDAVWKEYEKVLIMAKERFKSYKGSPYRYTHSYDLAKAMFDDDYYQAVLSGEEEIIIEPIKDKEKAWIFQGNPEVFDIERATEELSEMQWTVNRYKEDIKVGDTVYIWSSGEDAGIVAQGIIGSQVKRRGEDNDLKYYLDKKQLEHAEEETVVGIKEIKKLSKKLLREKLKNTEETKNLLVIRSPQGTNFPLEKEEHEKIMLLIKEKENGPSPIVPTYSIEECASDLYMEVSDIEKWVRSVERKGQAVLYGPPGTGKTYAAEKLANVLISEGEGSIETLQFHPAYSYEDFMQGIRPVTENGKLSYKMVQGRFMEFCERIRDKEGKSVLIIDEINRANLSRVFGELLYLLEYRDKSIPLAGGKSFSIPENLYIIGTMNTADRSIAIVDHALRRRFAFLELPTNYELLKEYHKASEFPVENLIQILRGVNATIGDRRYEVGISYFLKEALHEEIQDIWEMEIIPYLEEFFFDQPGKVEEFFWEKIEGRLLNEE